MTTYRPAPAITPPTEGDISILARSLGRDLSDDEARLFTELTAAALASHDVVDALYAAERPDPPRRAYTEPASADNPHGAWFLRTDLSAHVEGPLTGRTVAIKDSIAIAGLPMAAGSKALEGFIPTLDATAVTRLLAAGARINGKTVCEDLCYSGSSFTSASGPVANPWDTDYEAGGSSSGSAAVIASGAADLALGGDTGGSIRIPAAFCGIVGHKPTHGLVPYTGSLPYERTLEAIGPMTASVADAARMLTVLAGTDGQDPRQPSIIEAIDYHATLDHSIAGLRIGLLTEGFAHPESQHQVDELVRSAATRLAETVAAQPHPVSIPEHRHAVHAWNVIFQVGGTYQALLGNLYGMNVDGFYDPELIEHFGRRKVENSSKITDLAYAVGIPGLFGITVLNGSSHAKARTLATSIRAAYDASLSEVDVLIMPTIPFTARKLPTEAATRQDRVRQASTLHTNTSPFNLTGHPAVSVPAGLVEGLPVGMMIVGRRFEDQTPLRVAHAWEQLCGGFPTPAL